MVGGVSWGNVAEGGAKRCKKRQNRFFTAIVDFSQKPCYNNYRIFPFRFLYDFLMSLIEVDILYHLTVNTFNGREYAQIQIVDFRLSE